MKYMINFLRSTPTKLTLLLLATSIVSDLCVELCTNSSDSGLPPPNEIRKQTLTKTTTISTLHSWTNRECAVCPVVLGPKAIFASCIPEIIDLIGTRPKYGGTLKNERGRRWESTYQCARFNCLPPAPNNHWRPLQSYIWPQPTQIQEIQHTIRCPRRRTAACPQSGIPNGSGSSTQGHSAALVATGSGWTFFVACAEELLAKFDLLCVICILITVPITWRNSSNLHTIGSIYDCVKFYYLCGKLDCFSI